jgi:hypothetical protein
MRKWKLLDLMYRGRRAAPFVLHRPLLVSCLTLITSNGCGRLAKRQLVRISERAGT